MRFPAMRWPQLLRTLEGEPLRYRVVRQSGSHVKLESDAGYPPLYLAGHASTEFRGAKVRKPLMEQVGLTEDEAFSLL